MANPNCRRVAVSVIFFLLCALSGFVPPLGAASVEDIALMNRADRQKILLEGAKKEGKVSWYTTLIVDQVVRPVKDAFEKEYPIHPARIFPRQLRAHRAENARRISSQKIRRRYHRRHGVDRPWCGAPVIYKDITRRCSRNIPPSSKMPRVFGARRTCTFLPPAITPGWSSQTKSRKPTRTLPIRVGRDR